MMQFWRRLKLKQEKKQTVSLDFETRLQPWQEQALGRISRGAKKGEPIIIYGAGRRSGKSRVMAMYMGGSVGGTAIFGSPWGKWTETFAWPWSRKLSVESDKLIWGRIMVRQHMVRYGMDGERERQYATKREVFQRKLKGVDE
jgi:hypothetical protein